MTENKKEKEEICACAPCGLSLRDVDTVQTYLSEVVERLVDVMTALEGGKFAASVEKGNLTHVGRSFEYQQGMIDICDEIAKYATGEVSLTSAIAELVEAKKKMEKTEETEESVNDSSGMEVV